MLFFVSGLVAETVSCLLWLPMDVVKERLQVQKNLGIYEYTSTSHAIKQILKTEGITGLYRVCILR